MMVTYLLCLITDFLSPASTEIIISETSDGSNCSLKDVELSSV